MNLETKWAGDEKLVIAIDCGTTQTAVTYAYLFPQGIPSVKRVVDWPGQGRQQGEAKIPTLVWYDNQGNPRAFGAEAHAIDLADAEEKGWQLAENFKLHLHPATMNTGNKLFLNPLPEGVTIDKIYAGFFRYVYEHTQNYFKEHELQGTKIWLDLAQRGRIEFVIAHPNGWTLTEQSFLREAAVRGGLTPQSDALRTVHMITEAEASVHFVIAQGAIGNRLERGVNLLVCDAGGSTVDTTLYTVTGTFPNLELQEKRASACVQAGGIFVNEEAAKFVSNEFRRGDVSATEVLPLPELEEEFESGKKDFCNPRKDNIKLRVGMTRLNIDSINVRRGSLTIEGSQVTKFFSRPVEDIITSVKEQRQGHIVKYLMLVGGFGDSPYLRGEIRRHFCETSEIFLANGLTGKAVADGAIAWYIRRTVTGRATRFAYGTNVNALYNPSDWRHNGRPLQCDFEGKFVTGVWSGIVAKDHTFKYNELKRRSYYRTYTSPRPSLGNFVVGLYAYTQVETPSYFVVDDAGGAAAGFTKVCEIVADLSNMVGALQKSSGPAGAYWKVNFDIGIQFGTAELAAKVFWKNAKGHECWSQATVIPKHFS